MGASSSKKLTAKAAPSAAPVSRNSEVWVTVKAKTTDKTTRSVTKKRWAFRASAAGVDLGSGRGAGISIADTNLNAVHARIFLNESGHVCVESKGRVYLLIGQGERSNGPVALERNQVVKMGACSLQVAETCLPTADNAPQPPNQSNTPTLEASNAYASGPADADDGAVALGGVGGHASDSICYICFDDSSTPDNILMESPCTCKKMVHKSCLQRWIATRGSRLCSICKAKLPIHSTVDAPFLVLQVVRHMRGLHWNGEREYIISFGALASQGRSVSIGSGSACDVCLPDPSLSRTHATIHYHNNNNTQGFTLQDCRSSAGTFLRLSTPYAVPEDGGATFKLGRTMLTVKTRRKTTAHTLSLLTPFRSLSAATPTPTQAATPEARETPGGPSEEASSPLFMRSAATAALLTHQPESLPLPTPLTPQEHRGPPLFDRDELLAMYLAEAPEDENLEAAAHYISMALESGGVLSPMTGPPVSYTLSNFLASRGICVLRSSDSVAAALLSPAASLASMSSPVSAMPFSYEDSTPHGLPRTPSALTPLPFDRRAQSLHALSGLHAASVSDVRSLTATPRAVLAVGGADLSVLDFLSTAGDVNPEQPIAYDDPDGSDSEDEGGGEEGAGDVRGVDADE